MRVSSFLVLLGAGLLQGAVIEERSEYCVSLTECFRPSAKDGIA